MTRVPTAALVGDDDGVVSVTALDPVPERLTVLLLPAFTTLDDEAVVDGRPVPVLKGKGDVVLFPALNVCDVVKLCKVKAPVPGVVGDVPFVGKGALSPGELGDESDAPVVNTTARLDEVVLLLLLLELELEVDVFVEFWKALNPPVPVWHNAGAARRKGTNNDNMMSAGCLTTNECTQRISQKLYESEDMRDMNLPSTQPSILCRSVGGLDAP